MIPTILLSILLLACILTILFQMRMYHSAQEKAQDRLISILSGDIYQQPPPTLSKPDSAEKQPLDVLRETLDDQWAYLPENIQGALMREYQEHLDRQQTAPSDPRAPAFLPGGDIEIRGDEGLTT